MKSCWKRRNLNWVSCELLSNTFLHFYILSGNRIIKNQNKKRLFEERRFVQSKNNLFSRFVIRSRIAVFHMTACFIEDVIQGFFQVRGFRQSIILIEEEMPLVHQGILISFDMDVADIEVAVGKSTQKSACPIETLCGDIHGGIGKIGWNPVLR